MIALLLVCLVLSLSLTLYLAQTSGLLAELLETEGDDA